MLFWICFFYKVGLLSQSIPHCGAQKIQCLDHALIRQMVGDDRSLAFRVNQSTFTQNFQMP